MPYLHIVNWRRHGEDESYCRVGFYEDKKQNLVDLEIAPECDWPKDADADFNPESSGDWDRVFYINDDISIDDGAVFRTPEGKHYRVRFEPIES
jgi:hypothetical protein